MLEPGFLDHRVVVDQRDEWPLRFTNSNIVPTCKPQIAARLDHADAREVLSHQRDGVVCGAVVNHQDFEVRIALSLEASEQIGEVSLPVEVHRYDAYERQIYRWHRIPVSK